MPAHVARLGPAYRYSPALRIYFKRRCVIGGKTIIYRRATIRRPAQIREQQGLANPPEDAAGPAVTSQESSGMHSANSNSQAGPKVLPTLVREDGTKVVRFYWVDAAEDTFKHPGIHGNAVPDCQRFGRFGFAAGSVPGADRNQPDNALLCYLLRTSYLLSSTSL
jgi:hypothetical protein